MSILSSLFGGRSAQTRSENDDSDASDFNADVSASIGLEFRSESEISRRDEDGSEQSETSGQDLSLDADSDALFESMRDSFSSDGSSIEG